MPEWDVIVIGAGASGLMCAATAGARGRRVLVLDHAQKPGKKLLISGGGKCNFTNYQVEANNYLCANPHFCKSALARFSQWDFLALVEKYGIAYEEREHGQLFCRDSARQILDMLLAECEAAGVRFHYGHEITRVVREAEGFTVVQGKARHSCKALVAATGGLSIPRSGASPLGLKLAEQFGIRVLPTRAGLVPFTLHKPDKEHLQGLSGISLTARVTAECGQAFKEQLLFTHRGLSGPVILQVSSYWQAGEAIEIDLLPEMELSEFLHQQTDKHPRQNLRNTLAKPLPRRLVDALNDIQDLLPKGLNQLTPAEIERIEAQVNRWQLFPNGTEGYRTAEVTLGGIDTDELSSKTLEAKRVPGLYFIGEVVDVAGHLGGYNFQWAWASGVAAGGSV